MRFIIEPAFYYWVYFVSCFCSKHGIIQLYLLCIHSDFDGYPVAVVHIPDEEDSIVREDIGVPGPPSDSVIIVIVVVNGTAVVYVGVDV